MVLLLNELANAMICNKHHLNLFVLLSLIFRLSQPRTTSERKVLGFYKKGKNKAISRIALHIKILHIIDYCW